MNPQDELLKSLAMRPEPWTAAEIGLNLLVAFLLGLFIAWLYRSTERALSTSFSFVNTLVMLAMLMALVMMVIGSNIARAFGLVGAMSIIRFRTVVKDTRDTAYVFFSLGAGMGAGSGNLKIAALGTLVVGLFIGVLHWTRHGAVARNEFLLSFQLSPSDDSEESSRYTPIFQRYLLRHELLNIKSLRFGETTRLTFHVVMRDPGQSNALVSELSALEGLTNVSLNVGEEAET